MEDSSQPNEMMSDDQLLHNQATNWETPPHVEEQTEEQVKSVKVGEQVESEKPVVPAPINSNATLAIRDSSIEREESKPISAEKKPVKRKVEPSPAPIAKRRATGPAKKPAEIDYKLLTPRYRGKPSKQMMFCQKILRELHTGRSHIAFTWPFLEPVDVEGLGLYDYYTVVKEPMDFSTMQKKLSAKQYANPEEFHDDMMLIISNCLRYNPEGQPVNKCGKDLKKFFESKWNDLPWEESPAPTPKPTPKSVAKKPKSTPKSTPKPKKITKSVSPIADVPPKFGKLDDNDQLNTLLLRVQNERQHVTTKLDSLKQYEVQLTQLRYNREEAQTEGRIPPSLSSELHTAIQNSLPTDILDKSKVESQNSFDAESDQLASGNHRNESDCEYQFDSDEEDEPMTFEEKESLTEAIAGFSDSRLARVSEIVLRREKEFSDIEPQDLEIDFEILASVTLRELEAYVKACKSKDNGDDQQ